MEGAHIGHGAIIHGAVIGRNCLIGMNSVVMDNVEIGEECIVGRSALSRPAKSTAQECHRWQPAKILRTVSDEMIH